MANSIPDQLISHHEERKLTIDAKVQSLYIQIQQEQQRLESTKNPSV